MLNHSFHNDEPTSVDGLNRNQFVRAFARIANSCDTPMVIGLYGTWGVGKTSLMKLIKNKLKGQNVPTVWFDAWQHQFDENPSLAFLHAIVDQLGLGKNQDFKKLLMVIAGAFGSMLLKATTNLSVKDIEKFGERFEEERFLVCENRVRLQNHIENMVSKARELKGNRIIFFIDDLDRCMPPKLLNLLETLKLYLNLPGCVYFIGADRIALEKSIKHNYEKLELSEADYLDKIIQLPFTIPPIEPDSMNNFIRNFLSKDLMECLELLVKGLGDNARQIKRFINTLNLNHQLAREVEIPEYDPKFLAFILLIQLRNIGLYRLITRQPAMVFQRSKGEEEKKTLFEEALENDGRLKDAFAIIELPEEENIHHYIYLTQFAKVSEEPVLEPVLDKDVVMDIIKIIRDHELWLETNMKEGKQADLSGVNLSAANLSGANLSRANLSRAYLRRVNLSGINISEAILNGADFNWANLKNANLSMAYLRSADLSGADLRGANLRGANLNRVNFSGADLSGAVLIEADLREARNLTIDQLSKAKSCYKSEFEPGLEQQINEKYPNLLKRLIEMKDGEIIDNGN